MPDTEIIVCTTCRPPGASRFVDTAQRLGITPFKEYVYATPIETAGRLVGEDEYA